MGTLLRLSTQVRRPGGGGVGAPRLPLRRAGFGGERRSGDEEYDEHAAGRGTEQPGHQQGQAVAAGTHRRRPAGGCICWQAAHRPGCPAGQRRAGQQLHRADRSALRRRPQQGGGCRQLGQWPRPGPAARRETAAAAAAASSLCPAADGYAPGNTLDNANITGGRLSRL